MDGIGSASGCGTVILFSDGFTSGLGTEAIFGGIGSESGMGGGEIALLGAGSPLYPSPFNPDCPVDRGRKTTSTGLP